MWSFEVVLSELKEITPLKSFLIPLIIYQLFASFLWFVNALHDQKNQAIPTHHQEFRYKLNMQLNH